MKLKWDQTGERIYETGVSNGVLYVQKANGSYDNGVAWNGLSTVTESPSGAESNAIYADNIRSLALPLRHIHIRTNLQNVMVLPRLLME